MIPLPLFLSLASLQLTSRESFNIPYQTKSKLIFLKNVILPLLYKISVFGEKSSAFLLSSNLLWHRTQTIWCLSFLIRRTGIKVPCPRGLYPWTPWALLSHFLCWSWGLTCLPGEPAPPPWDLGPLDNKTGQTVRNSNFRLDGRRESPGHNADLGQFRPPCVHEMNQMVVPSF